MGRAISIDPISFHNISLGEDNIIIMHDSTKSDKKGEKLVKKHCYAHPTKPICCINTALGIYLSLNQDIFRNSELLFRKNNTKDGAASSKYCDQLKKIFERHSDTVEMHVNKASAHGCTVAAWSIQLSMSF